MSTQRPFFGSFLAAFRAHSPQLSKSSSSISVSAAAASSASIWTAAATQQQAASTAANDNQTAVTAIPTTSSRPINVKSNHYAAQATAAAQDRQLVTSLSPLQHNVSPQTHLPRTPSSTGLPVYGPPNKPAPSYPSCQDVRRGRRGSDSSFESGGFREVRPPAGSEKWFIGGRTASGEEKYYKLSMIKRERSWDRISADQLSL
jgi:hypothetical protein